MRLALTSNGPGEFAGWVRPLVAALYEADPALDLSIFFVPDDYATGREADVARELFPQMRIFDSAAYVRFALGRAVEGAPARADVVQYLGGDLMHAAFCTRASVGGRVRINFGAVLSAKRSSVCMPSMRRMRRRSRVKERRSRASSRSEISSLTAYSAKSPDASDRATTVAWPMMGFCSCPGIAVTKSPIWCRSFSRWRSSQPVSTRFAHRVRYFAVHQ